MKPDGNPGNPASRDEHYSTVPWRTALERFGSAWVQLAEAQQMNPTLLPGWADIVLTNECRVENCRVLIRERSGQVAGIVPYVVETVSLAGFPSTKIALVSSLFSYHADLVCADDRESLFRALLRAEPTWDVLQVDNLIKGSPAAEALAQVAATLRCDLLTYPVDFAPYLPIDGTWEAFLASKDKKFRYKYRRRQESLSPDTGLTMRWYTDNDSVPELLKAMLHIESRSWKAQDDVAVRSTSREGTYYARLLPFLAANGDLLANVLFEHDIPIAYSLCCHHGRWVGQLKTAFDLSSESLSPGALVIDAAIEAAFERGADEFDFLGTPGKAAPEPHKMFWTKAVRQHQSHFLFARKPLVRLAVAAKRVKQQLRRRGLRI